MSYMFANATSFDQDFSTSDVSNLNTMIGMFHGAMSFNKNLCRWQDLLYPNVTRSAMFLGTTCHSAANEDFCCKCVVVSV